MSKSFQNISVVAAATLVSRVLGLGRDMLVTTVFGVGPLASAFYTAFTLPNLIRRLLGEGALTAAFVPTLNEELKAKERAGAFALVNTVGSWLLVASEAMDAAGRIAHCPLGGGRGLALKKRGCDICDFPVTSGDRS